MSKKKKYLIIMIIIIILILLLIIVTNVFNKDNININELEEGAYILPGEVKNTDMKKVSNRGLKKEKCIDDICISNVYIECSKDGGYVHFSVTNKGKETKSGYLKLIIGDLDSVIIYSKVEPGKTKKSSTQYSDKDLGKAKDYSIQEFTTDDYKRIVK